VTIIRFRHFRDYDEQRVLVNDSMMGLLAGSKLAAQTLRLSEGSEAHLADIFPSVAHIQRFNLRVDRASEVLIHAEDHLAAICIPYLMAAHEAFVKHAALKLCVDAGVISNAKFKAASMESMHETLAEVAPEGIDFAPDSLALFHVLRGMRNAIIHSNSRLSEQRHLDAIRMAGEGAQQLWTRLTRQPYPNYELGDPLKPSLEMLIATLAVTKRLADEANEILQQVLTTDQWQEIADEDWALNGTLLGNPQQRARRHTGFIRHNYPNLAR
jgi:hypothetical protein